MSFALSKSDAVWLTVLALVCTVYPYSAALELLKRFSVFTASLSINMEPVYGMILAALLLGENEQLGVGFYAGSSILIGAILIYLIVSSHRHALKGQAGN
jgi:drug/metabolite transporter (DMT)-like permease